MTVEMLQFSITLSWFDYKYLTKLFFAIARSFKMLIKPYLVFICHYYMMLLKKNLLNFRKLFQISLTIPIPDDLMFLYIN